MLTIDGGFQEGGGQVLRTALALSVLTQTPFKAERIRHSRPKPGLKAQHLACLTALQQMAGARAVGAGLGAESITFYPGPIRAGVYRFDIGTAGSITLLLQCLLLPAIFARAASQISVKGGTDTRWSIPADYFSHVIVPCLTPYAGIVLHAGRRGFYPKGQGQMTFELKPRTYLAPAHLIDAKEANTARHRLPAINFTQRREPIRIEGISAASERLRQADVVRRQVQGAVEEMAGRYPVHIKETYAPTASPGTIITLWVRDDSGRTTLGASALGAKGVPAEVVGQRAASRLLALLDSGAPVDPHLADNLVPLLGVVGGVLKTSRITPHILANIYVCKQFLRVSYRVETSSGLIAVA